jgi:hypothetical protein
MGSKNIASACTGPESRAVENNYFDKKKRPGDTIEDVLQAKNENPGLDILGSRCLTEFSPLSSANF